MWRVCARGVPRSQGSGRFRKRGVPVLQNWIRMGWWGGGRVVTQDGHQRQATSDKCGCRCVEGGREGGEGEEQA
jgi:hypothetical protein